MEKDGQMDERNKTPRRSNTRLDCLERTSEISRETDLQNAGLGCELSARRERGFLVDSQGKYV